MATEGKQLKKHENYLCPCCIHCLELGFQRGVEKYFRELLLFISSEAAENKRVNWWQDPQCNANKGFLGLLTSNRRQILLSHKAKPVSAAYSEIRRLLLERRAPCLLAFLKCNTLYIYTLHPTKFLQGKYALTPF